jgi:integrase
MRKSALLSLLWEDVDLKAGVALSRYANNKRKRDHRHSITGAASRLAELYAVRKPDDPRVFPWNDSERTVDHALHEIQRAAGIALTCREDRELSPTCHVYGFHAFRYAHATYNFGRAPNRELQQQMGHALFTTTERYI